MVLISDGSVTHIRQLLVVQQAACYSYYTRMNLELWWGNRVLNKAFVLAECWPVDTLRACHNNPSMVINDRRGSEDRSHPHWQMTVLTKLKPPRVLSPNISINTTLSSQSSSRQRYHGPGPPTILCLMTISSAFKGCESASASHEDFSQPISGKCRF